MYLEKEEMECEKKVESYYINEKKIRIENYLGIFTSI